MATPAAATFLSIPADVLRTHICRGAIDIPGCFGWNESIRVAWCLSKTCRRLRTIYDSRVVIWLAKRYLRNAYVSDKLLNEPTLLFHFAWVVQNHADYIRRAVDSKTLAMYASVEILNLYSRVAKGRWVGEAIQTLIQRDKACLAHWLWYKQPTRFCKQLGNLCHSAIRLDSPNALEEFQRMPWRGNIPRNVDEWFMLAVRHWSLRVFAWLIRNKYPCPEEAILSLIEDHRTEFTKKREMIELIQLLSCSGFARPLPWSIGTHVKMQSFLGRLCL